MGLGRIGRSYPTSKTMRGKCKEDGCTTRWDTTEEYLKCQGCSYHACKIAENFQRRQVANAKIEADKVIENMKHRNKHRQQRLERSEVAFTNEVETLEVPIESWYDVQQGETEMVKHVPPVLMFEIK